MKLYPYWARARATVQDSWSVEACGASSTSLEDARANARRIAERAAAALRSDEMPGEYDYADRPLREELVQLVGDPAAPAGALTRNAYGALVLNAERALFADLDYASAARPGCLGGLFGGRGKADDAIVERVRELTARDNRVAVRLYRTAAGFRCLVTHRTYDATSDEAAALLGRLQSDPLYVRLCAAQACFRARVSPKPWRMEVPRPPARFPFEDEARERAYRRWNEDYVRASAAYSTCAFVAAFGSGAVHPDVAPVLALHEELACRGDRPLA